MQTPLARLVRINTKPLDIRDLSGGCDRGGFQAVICNDRLIAPSPPILK
jgi:hypothetical protein